MKKVRAPQPGCAADTAGAAIDLGAIYPQTATALRLLDHPQPLWVDRLPKAPLVVASAARSLLVARGASARSTLDGCQRRS
jgi:hypothetical protein